MSAEVKVGAIFVVVVLAATAVALYLGGMWARVGTYSIYVRFADAGTVEPGADVMLSGVRVGTVAEVELAPDERRWPGKPVRMRLAIKRDVKIPADYEMAIAQGGLLATRYISIHPPKKPTRAGGFLQAGAEVEGAGLVGLAALDSLAETAKEGLPQLQQQITEKIDRLTGQLEKFLSDENAQALHEILVNVSQLTATANRAALNAERLTRTMADAARRGSPEAVETIRQLRVAAANIRKAAETVHRMVATSPLPTDLAAAGQNIRKASEAMAETADAVREMAASPQTKQRVEELVANLQQASESLARLTENLNKLAGDQKMQQDLKASVADMRAAMENVRATSEHLRRVLTDKQMTEDLKATVHNLRELTNQGKQVAEKANKSLDRVDRTMDRLSTAVQSIKPSYVRGELDLVARRHTGLQADLDLDLYFGQQRQVFWRLGMVDIGDSERLDLQRGFRLGRSWRMRAGIFANKVGVGLDYLGGGPWSAELELWDPDETYLDLHLFHRLQPQLQVDIGVHDLFGNNDYFIGVRKTFDVSGSK